MPPLITPSPERAPWALVIRGGLQTFKRRNEFTTRQQMGQDRGKPFDCVSFASGQPIQKCTVIRI